MHSASTTPLLAAGAAVVGVAGVVMAGLAPGLAVGRFVTTLSSSFLFVFLGATVLPPPLSCTDMHAI